MSKTKFDNTVKLSLFDLHRCADPTADLSQPTYSRGYIDPNDVAPREYKPYQKRYDQNRGQGYFNSGGDKGKYDYIKNDDNWNAVATTQQPGPRRLNNDRNMNGDDRRQYRPRGESDKRKFPAYKPGGGENGSWLSESPSMIQPSTFQRPHNGGNYRERSSRPPSNFGTPSQQQPQQLSEHSAKKVSVKFLTNMVVNINASRGLGEKTEEKDMKSPNTTFAEPKTNTPLSVSSQDQYKNEIPSRSVECFKNEKNDWGVQKSAFVFDWNAQPTTKQTDMTMTRQAVKLNAKPMGKPTERFADMAEDQWHPGSDTMKSRDVEEQEESHLDKKTSTFSVPGLLKTDVLSEEVDSSKSNLTSSEFISPEPISQRTERIKSLSQLNQTNLYKEEQSVVKETNSEEIPDEKSTLEEVSETAPVPKKKSQTVEEVSSALTNAVDALGTRPVYRAPPVVDNSEEIEKQMKLLIKSRRTVTSKLPTDIRPGKVSSRITSETDNDLVTDLQELIKKKKAQEVSTVAGTSPEKDQGEKAQNHRANYKKLQQERRLKKQQEEEQQKAQIVKIKTIQVCALKEIFLNNIEYYVELENNVENILKSSPKPEDALVEFINEHFTQDHFEKLIPSVFLAKVLIYHVYRALRQQLAEQPISDLDLMDKVARPLVAKFKPALQHVFSSNCVGTNALQFLEGTQIFSTVLQHPKVTDGLSLIEALWDSLYMCDCIPASVFFSWQELVDNSTPGRSDILFQMFMWFDWLKVMLNSEKKIKNNEENNSEGEDFDYETENN